MGSLGAWLCLASVGSYKLQEGRKRRGDVAAYIKCSMAALPVAQPWRGRKRALDSCQAHFGVHNGRNKASFRLCLSLSLSLSVLQAPINTLRSVSFDLCAGSRQEAAALKIAAC